MKFSREVKLSVWMSIHRKHHALLRTDISSLHPNTEVLNALPLVFSPKWNKVNMRKM